MAYNLLKGKRGIITGALDENLSLGKWLKNATKKALPLL